MTDNAALARLLPVVVDGAIDLVLKSQGPDRRVGAPDDFLESDMPPGYSLIYNEGAGYMYREKRRRRKSKQGTADSAADAAKGEAVQSPADRAENENDALNQSVNSAELMESSVEED